MWSFEQLLYSNLLDGQGDSHTIVRLARCEKLYFDSYRVGDNDARCGPASIQVFDGEDLSAAERSQAQHQQCYDWWEAQRAQHAAQKAAQAELLLREQAAVMIKSKETAQPDFSCCM